jgi:adenylate kinase
MSGTVELATALAAEYKLNLLTKQGVVDHAIGLLKAAVAAGEAPPSTTDNNDDGGDESAASANDDGAQAVEIPQEVLDAAREAKDKLAELEESKTENKGSYTQEQVIEWTRDRVLSMGCQNQGYVIVDFPETDEQAGQIFQAADDAEDPDAPNPLTVPEFVFALDAPDGVLMERAMNLSPEEAPEGSPFSEQGMKAGLPAFRKRNDEDAEREEGTTVLNFFDFKEIHPVYIDVAELTHEDVVKAARVALPAPRNYGPT